MGWNMNMVIAELRNALGGDYAQGEHWDFEAINQAIEVIRAARSLCQHDGGPGSTDYDARKVFDAMRGIRNLLSMYPTETGKFYE